MPEVIDETGKRYGHVTVLERSDNSGDGSARWLCRCDCGKEFVTKGNTLRSGRCRSCGCNVSGTKGRYTHHNSGTRLYYIWANMKRRCFSPSSPFYKNYGARGVTICNERIEFEPFRDWALSNGYADNLTIDRIDVNGNYEPGNCRWSTRQEQNRNTRRSVIVEYDGVKMNACDMADTYGIDRSRFLWRLKHGWTVRETIETKPKEKRVEG